MDTTLFFCVIYWTAWWCVFHRWWGTRPRRFKIRVVIGNTVVEADDLKDVMELLEDLNLQQLNKRSTQPQEN